MKKFIAMIVITITLGACSKSAGDNYVGQWQVDGNSTLGQNLQIMSKNANQPLILPIITITKSGDLYLVKDGNDSILKMERFCPTGATLKETKLVCNPEFELTFDATTGKLLTPTLGTFTKIN